MQISLLGLQVIVHIGIDLSGIIDVELGVRVGFFENLLHTDLLTLTLLERLLADSQTSMT